MMIDEYLKEAVEKTKDRYLIYLFIFSLFNRKRATNDNEGIRMWSIGEMSTGTELLLLYTNNSGHTTRR